MTPYWWVKYVVVLVVGGVIAGGAAWKIQGMRMTALKTDNKALTEARAVDAKTIAELTSANQKASESCTARLKAKDTLIRKLKEVDALEAPSEENGNTDTLLDGLNGLFVDR
ncbi:MAG: hypothetical protein ACYDHW_07000 [Syntrophorhabdaceae bacterium]